MAPVLRKPNLHLFGRSCILRDTWRFFAGASPRRLQIRGTLVCLAGDTAIFWCEKCEIIELSTLLPYKDDKANLKTKDRENVHSPYNRNEDLWHCEPIDCLDSVRKHHIYIYTFMYILYIRTCMHTYIHTYMYNVYIHKHICTEHLASLHLATLCFKGQSRKGGVHALGLQHRLRAPWFRRSPRGNGRDQTAKPLV